MSAYQNKFLIASLSLGTIFFSACSTAKAPALLSKNQNGMLLLEGANNHGEKLWYKDSIRVKSEMWQAGQKHGLSVHFDNLKPECIVYMRFNQGSESGSDLSENCVAKANELEVQKSFESHDQAMLNYEELFNDWVTDLKTKAQSRLVGETIEDHAFEMGLRYGLKLQVKNFLKMEVDQPEWQRVLNDIDPSQLKLLDFKASLEFPHSKAGKAFKNSVQTGMSQAGYPSGSDDHAYSWGFLLGQYSARKTLGESLLVKEAWLKANLYQVEKLESILLGKNTTVKSGEWAGTPGDSYWLSFKDEVLMVTGGEGILFYGEIPALSPWSRMGILTAQLPQPESPDAKMQAGVQKQYKWDAQMFDEKSKAEGLAIMNLGSGRYELIPEVLKDEVESVLGSLTKK